MIYANLQSPQRTMFGKFSMKLALACGVDGFTKDNIVLSGHTTDVDFTLYNVDCGYTLHFTLPQNTAGTFIVALAGQVAVDGIQTDLEQVSASVSFDTQTSISVEYGEIIYRNREIRLPITFPENIKTLSKRHFNIVYSGGKKRTLVYGSQALYTLVMRHVRSNEGTITVDFVNPVIKANGISVDVDIDTLIITYPKVG